MIIIDKKYDIVLTYSPCINEITGHLFECFDYFLCLSQKYNIQILLLNPGLTLSQVETAFTSKYNIDFSVVKDHIRIISEPIYNTVLQVSSNTILFIVDGNISEFLYNKITILAKKILCFMCYQKDSIFDKSSFKHSKILYLQDYRIYGKNILHKSIDYVKKIPFQYYKSCISPQQNIGMMYITYDCRKVTPNIIYNYHINSGCSKTYIAVPYKIKEFNNIDQNIIQIQIPIKNFFDTFDTYIYTPVPRCFDCSPRLITECFMYKKSVFIDINYNDLGLITRYNDCKNNIQSLNLTLNDNIFTIIEKFIYE